MHSETAIVRHSQVEGVRSPYDGDIPYWSKRLSNHPMLKTEKGILLKRCKGKCISCGLHFRDGDRLEVDHHIPLYLGGKNILDNKNILHRHCHDQRHAQFEETRRRSEQATQMNDTHDKSRMIEEPYAGKLACTVLKNSQTKRLMGIRLNHTKEPNQSFFL